VIKVWVNPIVVVPFDVCFIVSNKPPSIDKFNIEGEIPIRDAVGTNMRSLRFDPIHFPFDFGREVVFKMVGYNVDGI
jgi:hypothetical protein